MPARCHHQIGWFDVPVCDALCMGHIQRVGSLHGNVDDVRRRERPPRDSGRDGLPLDVFHDDEVKTVALTNVMNSGDIRMIQRRRRPGFALEALHPLRVRCQVARENLERDGPIQPRVAREVHLTHPARAKQGQDLVVTERCAEERILVSVSRWLGRHVQCRPFQE